MGIVYSGTSTKNNSNDLVFSSGIVKNNTLGLTKAYLPTDPELCKRLWDFWRDNQALIKSHGYGLSKDQEQCWQVVCWTTLDKSSHDRVPPNNEARWVQNAKTKFASLKEQFDLKYKPVKVTVPPPANYSNLEYDDDLDEEIYVPAPPPVTKIVYETQPSVTTTTQTTDPTASSSEVSEIDVMDAYTRDLLKKMNLGK